MSEPELLPCPFCGGEASGPVEVAGVFMVRCEMEDCTVQQRAYTGDEVVGLWNARACYPAILRLMQPIIIRAFVERVYKRTHDTSVPVSVALVNELAAMEKENG